ncbi:alternative ribosome rescue aminoacyl-tRNA hydrolase ArfB [Nocardiopsis coralliicola]
MGRARGAAGGSAPAGRPALPEVPPGELTWRFSRSPGPGGQHVNTADTRAAVSVDVAATSALDESERARALERLAPRLAGTVLTATAADTRSQGRNRELALERLRHRLAEAAAPPPKERRATRPSRAARRRRMDAKSRRSALKRTRGRPAED